MEDSSSPVEQKGTRDREEGDLMDQEKALTQRTEALGAVVASAGSITAAVYGMAKLCLSLLG